MVISKFGYTMVLCPEKVIFLSDRKTLLMADVHLGKASHFRKAGLGIPLDIYKQDLRSLNDVIIKYQPEEIVIMGDLFHSTYNFEWEEFLDLLSVFKDINFILLKGNHDILLSKRYKANNLIVKEQMEMNNIILTHEPLNSVPEGRYNLYGHIHPAVRIKGRSKQSLRLPCFIFTEDSGILPAFGRFTGLATLKPNKSSEVYVVSENEVIQLQ